jgi:hypothetical protein
MEGDFPENHRFRTEESMAGRKALPALLGAFLFLLLAGTACNLNLTSDIAGTPQYIVVTATGQSGEGGAPPQAEGGEASTEELPPALSPTGTLTPTITPTFTPIAPTMTAGQDLSCVKGPHWIFYEWVTRINEGETVTLLAKASEEWEEYYWVRKSEGTECWAFGGSSTKTGDYLNLPVREAPPLPEIHYTIENKTALPVLAIYIREKDAAAWGPNKLTGLLSPGSTFSMDLTAGFYDILVQDPALGNLYEKYDWPIGSEESYRNIVLNQKIDFYIQNNYAFELCNFSIRPTGGSWETIHAGTDGHITPGSKLNFTILPGFYDLQIQRCGAGFAVDIAGLYFGPAIPGYTFP